MPKSLLAPRALTLALLTAAAGGTAAHPAWARSLGLDVWNVPALRAQVRASAEEADRLADEGEQVLGRIAIKEALIAELIAGRSTLAATADAFAELDSARPVYAQQLRRTYPGADDREVFSRIVIAFAVARVAPHERPALSGRLQAELRQARAAD